MSSEIRANLISSRAGLSTVTMTDSGPMFSGITTFVDNSGFTFGVGGGTSIFTPATNVLTFGTNNTEKIRIDASGHMHGVGVITATHFYGDGSNLTGISAGFSPDAQGNLVAGTNAGANFSGTDPVHNILIGYEAGNALTTADYSVAIGYHALKSVDTESYNVAIGYNALKELTGMGGNVAVGYQAGYYTYNMYQCVAVGYNAMSKPVQSGVNTWYSVAVGANAMGSCGGDRCTAVGHEALEGNNAGTADDNTAIGHQSLMNLLSNGFKNTAVGTFSGKGTTSGDENVYIGYNAGNNAHATGSNCIIIGNNSAASSTSVSNEVSIGNTSITKFRIPGLNYYNDAGKVGLGTTGSDYALSIREADNNNKFLMLQKNSGQELLQIREDGDNHVIIDGSHASGELHFYTAGTEKMRLDTNGRLGIGTNNPSTILDARGNVQFGDGGGFDMNVLGTRHQFSINGSEKLRITSTGQLNLGGSSTQTTHLLHLQSTGDAGIHIRADSDNSGESDNPYLSMSQDGSTAQQLKIGLEGSAGSNFTESLTNSPFIHANNSASQPLQLAHMDTMIVSIANRKNEIELNDYTGNSVAGMEIQHYGNDTAAALKLTGHNNTGTPGVETYTQLTHRGANAEFEIHHMGSRAMNIGSTRRIRVPGIVGVAGSGLQTVYVESDGNLCTTSSLREFKTNITSISDTSWLFNLNPVTFNWKKKTEVNGENVWEDTADDNGTQYGLIAEEVETVKKDFCSYDNNNKLTGVHYDRLIAPLIKAVQDLKSEMNILQQENIALRVRVTNLEDK